MVKISFGFSKEIDTSVANLEGRGSECRKYQVLKVLGGEEEEEEEKVDVVACNTELR